jgi:FKBP-type peptidyl-prolyl cis-trans isomerase FkpA
MNKLVCFLSFFILVVNACKKDYDKIDKEKIDDYAASKNITTKSTASGVQYVIEKEGVGENLSITDEVAVKYKGYFLDDSVFDKSDSAIFYLSGVIEGWKDGLQNFKEGSKGKIFVPSDLAYGKTGVTSNSGTKIIPSRAVVAFDVEILRKNPVTNKNRQDIKAFIKSKNWKADSLASGLFYVIDEPGTGNNPSANSNVTVKYKGYTLDGKVFDQSDNTGLTFNLGGVIEGWRQGIPLFKKGGKGKLLIPARLAYYNGTATIPAYSPLVFEVELLNF